MPSGHLPNHDLALAFSTTDQGLILAEEEGRKLYRASYALPLSPRMGIGEASYADFPPDQELPIPQDEWHAGFGELVHKYGARYAYSVGVDAREKNKLKLFGKENAVTVTLGTTPVPANIGFETWIAHFNLLILLQP